MSIVPAQPKRDDVMRRHTQLLSRGACDDPVRARDHPFAFEFFDGWLSVVDEALTEIEQAVSEMSPTERAAFHISQIKEKFGGLRLYYHPRNARIDAIVSQATKRAFLTCEECADFGMLHLFGGHLYATRCRACAHALSAARWRTFEAILPRHEAN